MYSPPSTVSAILLFPFLVIPFLYLLKWAKGFTRTYMLLKNIPGPPFDGILIGNMLFFGVSPEEIFRRMRQVAKNFYPLYKVQGIHKFSVGILTPEDAELILSDSVHNQKGYMYNLFHKWLKSGLFTSSGAKWQTRRKLLTPTFHFNILQQFVAVFNEQAEELVEALKEECHKSYVKVNPLVAQFTLKAITETAMGTKLSFSTKKDAEYIDAIHELTGIIVYRLTHPWCIESIGNLFSPWFVREISITKILHRFTKNVIQERERKFNDFEEPTEEYEVYKGKRRLAMLDLLLSIKKKEGTIDNEGIQEEVDTFTFGGHDTASGALCFILMLLACHREVQNRIIQEMKDVLQDIHKKPTYNDFQNMKYLEHCIKESLRLYPSGHLLSRTIGEDVKLNNGQILPKGIDATVLIYDIHHDPRVYPDAEKFDPDRFLPENVKNRHPYAYLTFSAGPRNCIGQKSAMLEFKAALCAILANFVLEPIDTPETIDLTAGVVLGTKEDIKVRFVLEKKIEVSCTTEIKI